MPEFKLLIGYRHTSSWSLRGWMMMRKTGAPFEEVMIRYRRPEDKAKLRALSPAGKVPFLIHEQSDGQTIRVWDSIAIGEYLAELFPQKQLWPADRAARAMARSVSAEMHSSFRALRDRLDMKLLDRIPDVRTDDGDVASDLARITALWTEARETFGIRHGGPYLFGDFSIADAMYAPVATRFRTYGVTLTSPVAEAYKHTMLADPDMMAWEAQARLDPPPEPLVAH
ncbi:MAG: glutathione S-transferase family protein [Bauldia sp.]|nr:glutathione S-transferase family protein [Bauldia sp.]